MLRNSIQRRLVTSVVLSQTLLAAGLLLAGVFYTHRRLLSTLDAGVQGRAMSVAALVRYKEDKSGNVYFDNTLMPPSIDPNHPDVFAIWTERSGLLLRSANWPQGLEIPTSGRTKNWNFKWGSVRYRALRLSSVPVLDREEAVSFRPQTLTIIYAAPLHRTYEQLQRAAAFIALASVLLLGITELLALWGIRRALRPLQQLAADAALVSAQNWQLRLPQEARQLEELRPLTESMTTMLARLQRAFEQQKEFMGNAAHELKTPVAVLKSTLQSLLQRPRTSDEYKEGLELSLEDLERLEQLLQWMLRLARAEQWGHGALRGHTQKVDVAATCEEAIARIRGLAEAQHTEIRFSKLNSGMLEADPEDLQLIWTNILENAVRYSPRGQPIEMSISRDNGSTKVTVKDHGTGIAPVDLPHIFERFYRGDPSRTRASGGFGLGLAIARALVQAYGGAIAATSTPGEGTLMTVELPAKLDNQQ
ncbi:MAG: hypothetical protein NVS1B11_03240 [Terriglobales bacterium]